MHDYSESKDTIRFVGDWHYAIPKSVAHNTQLSAGARMLWVVLAGFAAPSPTGGVQNPFPSRTTLQRLMCSSRNTVKKWVDELEAIGLVEVNQIRENGTFSSCEYTLRSVHQKLVTGPGTKNWRPNKAISLDPASGVVQQRERGQPPSTQKKQSKLALAGQTPVGGPWPLNEEEVVAHFEAVHEDQLTTDLEKSAKTYFRKYAAKNWRMPDGNVIWDWKGYAASVWVPRWIANRKTRKKALQKRGTLDMLES